MGWNERMRDAADPGGLHGWGGRVAGYLPGGDQFRAWSPAEWAQFGKQPKLPIFVRVNPAHPEDDAFNVLRSLHLLGVPAGRGIWTALDLETVKAPGYVGAYGQACTGPGSRWPFTGRPAPCLATRRSMGTGWPTTPASARSCTTTRKRS